MVNFKNLVKKRRTIDVTNLLDLFNSLDRHTSHIELRPAQEQALCALTERRIGRDHILKVSTGAGKTSVGLIYLLSHMEEKEEPVVYLCPTVQLVEQVQEEAIKLGIPAVVYPAKETYPDADGTSGKAVIICTYAKLFNAKTTFDRTDVHLRPCAIVLDDAHAGVEEVRDKFTLRITESLLLKKLQNLFDATCANFRPGIWPNIVAEDPCASLEVPYWIWKPLVSEVHKLLMPHAEEDSFIFVWPFLRDLLKWCRCIVSGTCIEIIPDILPVHKSEAYTEATHRLFMSATLADDSVLIREIGCDISAARKPILPKKDYGLGERMVLVPSLIDKKLNRAYVMNLCAKLSQRVNVVVLSPSGKMAREWETVGAKVVLKDNVSSAVRDLKNPTSGVRFVVFAQRYDGVDLPDNACRVLVIDGMPYGEGITDKYDSGLKSVPGGIRNLLIYRIEQGMGRAVRSHVDYAVIILASPDLANFIAKSEVLNAMNPDSKAQLKLALDLAKLAKEDAEQDPSKALVSMIQQCLKRDEDWKQYYEENVKNIKIVPKQTDEIRLVMAESERKAYQFSLGNNPSGAVKLLRKSLNENEVSEKEKGWYLQKIASYMFDVNPSEYLEIQRSAYEKNNSLFCPPSVTSRPLSLAKSGSPAIILEWFKEFENPNGTIAAIQDLRARLSYDVSPETIEQAIMELAQLLGATGMRPEKEFGEGPDDLWLWPSISLVIEAKNENEDSLHKKDAGQLLLSLQWFCKNYPTRENQIPIIVAKVNKADNKSGFPEGAKVLTPSKMNDLLNSTEKFYQAILQELPTSLQTKRIAELQSKFGISPEQFVGKYTVALK